MISSVEPLDLLRYGTLSFFAPDDETFLCLKAARLALQRGGLVPAAVNGADEAAVQLFLEGKISFPEIGDIVYEVAQRDWPGAVSISEISRVDVQARDYVRCAADRKSVV